MLFDMTPDNDVIDDIDEDWNKCKELFLMVMHQCLSTVTIKSKEGRLEILITWKTTRRRGTEQQMHLKLQNSTFLITLTPLHQKRSGK